MTEMLTTGRRGEETRPMVTAVCPPRATGSLEAPGPRSGSAGKKPVYREGRELGSRPAEVELETGDESKELKSEEMNPLWPGSKQPYLGELWWRSG